MGKKLTYEEVKKYDKIDDILNRICFQRLSLK